VKLLTLQVMIMHHFLRCRASVDALVSMEPTQVGELYKPSNFLFTLEIFPHSVSHYFNGSESLQI